MDCTISTYARMKLMCYISSRAVFMNFMNFIDLFLSKLVDFEASHPVIEGLKAFHLPALIA